MTDIRQSKLYAEFMRSIGWKVEEIDGVYAYIKPFPLIGATIKIQRPNKLPEMTKLEHLKKRYRARSISIEPDFSHNLLPTTYNLLKDPYLPTKTILIDLKPSEQIIFSRFSEAKRRAVRRAEKGSVIASEGAIDEFIKLKNKTAGLFGFLTTTTLKPLWNTFSPQQATVLLTNSPAAILLLFHQKTAYYWMAGATEAGKKSFAPTLMVWEALKLSKQKGCEIFDFEGIYDERYPNLNKNWLGFTKFKQGFGGKEVEYPKPLSL